MKAVIFGGGKISRGFVAQLLHRSDYYITFVEINERLVQSLNQRKQYYVNVMGNPKESQWISNYHCVKLTDIPSIATALEDADIVFTSVGGKNLDELAGTIAKAYTLVVEAGKAHVFTIVTCENWKEPAAQLRAGVLRGLKDENLQHLLEQQVGFTEAVIMRSGVEATEEVLKIDPNAVSVTNFWELPIDKSRMKGELLLFKGVNYKDNFSGFLQQKLFTFNTTNATISYLGRLRGIELLADAANDPEIVEIVRQVHEEINPAIAKEMRIEPEEQQAFSQKALKKYQDKSVTDFTERHARDPIRKIGPFDRIVGTLRLVEKHGLSYRALATTLAAALYYPVTNPEDPTAEKLLKMREEQGIDMVLEQVCKISPTEKAAEIIKEQIQFLGHKGWLTCTKK